MINELFELIDGHRMAACIAVAVFIVVGSGAICLLSAASGPSRPAAAPTVLATDTPLPTAPLPTATPGAATPAPSQAPTPAPSPTVTPDVAIARSISPLDQYAPNHMVQVDQSTEKGILSVDLFNSDAGGQYAYVGDTYTDCLTLADDSGVPIDRVKISTSCINRTDSGHILYEDDRIDYVLLSPGDKIRRTVGFTVPSDAPEGVYRFRTVVSADLQGNGTWSDFCCSYESGLNILATPQ